MVITKCLYWFLKVIQPAKGGLDKYYINIYTFLCICLVDIAETNLFTYKYLNKTEVLNTTKSMNEQLELRLGLNK